MEVNVPFNNYLIVLDSNCTWKLRSQIQMTQFLLPLQLIKLQVFPSNLTIIQNTLPNSLLDLLQTLIVNLLFLLR